ncbi:hypothetical protein EN829_072940, partial [Mesorhizobium sp. M00.F.Ca.ET.186.01.1.1]
MLTAKADIGIARNQAGDIDRQEARAANGAGGGEDHQRQGQHEDRQQAAVMDLSTGRNIHNIRDWIVRNAPVPIGTVP